MKRSFCYICEGAAAGLPLPATLAWWILWRGVNYSSLCRGWTLNFLEVRGVEELGCALIGFSACGAGVFSEGRITMKITVGAVERFIRSGLGMPDVVGVVIESVVLCTEEGGGGDIPKRIWDQVESLEKRG